MQIRASQTQGTVESTDEQLVRAIASFLAGNPTMVPHEAHVRVNASVSPAVSSPGHHARAAARSTSSSSAESSSDESDAELRAAIAESMQVAEIVRAAATPISLGIGSEVYAAVGADSTKCLGASDSGQLGLVIDVVSTERPQGGGTTMYIVANAAGRDSTYAAVEITTATPVPQAAPPPLQPDAATAAAAATVAVVRRGSSPRPKRRSPSTTHQRAALPQTTVARPGRKAVGHGSPIVGVTRAPGRPSAVHVNDASPLLARASPDALEVGQHARLRSGVTHGILQGRFSGAILSIDGESAHIQLDVIDDAIKATAYYSINDLVRALRVRRATAADAHEALGCQVNEIEARLMSQDPS